MTSSGVIQERPWSSRSNPGAVLEHSWDTLGAIQELSGGSWSNPGVIREYLDRFRSSPTA